MTALAATTRVAHAEGSAFTWLGAIVRTFSNWIAYRRTVGALNALSDRELDDIGVARSEIPHVARARR